eukprot:CAMPEP_0168562254 /NCGR_PEP_ID=MMETSP0413-20121227/12025_1 /TAXON_ID=136452 /ORGANISM="Filamoeba nolandi, Strain NC-AS-23-1" /LENGTH=182 /DNA_ID=CAMNT_0008593669 /DNA_START=383 /DNA_END=931 /DNA_ORIENTATION=+
MGDGSSSSNNGTTISQFKKFHFPKAFLNLVQESTQYFNHINLNLNCPPVLYGMSYSSLATDVTIANETFYVCSDQGSIRAFDLRTSTLRWTFHLANIRIFAWLGFHPDGRSAAGSIVVDRTRLFASIGKTLVALDSKTGKALWTTSTSSVFGLALHNNMVLCFGDGIGNAFEPATGKELIHF